MEKILKNKILILINVLILIYIINITNCFQLSPNMINIINEYININDNETDIDNDTNTKDLEILYGNISHGIIKFINENIIGNSTDNFTKTDCYLDLKDISNDETQKKIKSMIQYSNFQISRDISHEIECKTNKLTYSLISYKLEKTSNISLKNKALLEFLNYRIYFSIGLCLTDKCLEILEVNFDNNTNDTNVLHLKNGTKLYNYLNNKVNVTNFTLFKNKDDTQKTVQKNGFGFLAIIITLLLIILIRIFFSIYTNIKLIYVSKKNLSSQSKTLSNNSSFSNSQNSSGSEDFFLYNQKYQDNANEIKEDSLLEEKYIHFLDFISIFKNLSALGEDQNYMYNNINLEVPCAFQAISLFFFALVSTFNNFIYYPSSDYFNNEIFIGFGISLVKFAQYSSYFYLSLNAFIYSFKFMSYYKKYIHKQLKKIFSLIFLYLLTFIPKIIMFIVSSFVFHLYSIDIIDYISNYLHQDEYKIRLKPRECININMYEYLFFFSSYTKNDKTDGFILCYNYVYSYVNEFYSVIFFIIIFCISIKARSIIIDIIIILLVVINLILNFIFFDYYSYKTIKYDFTSFLGEKLSIKYFHIYLNIFFYGVFAGIIHFYNIDIISTDRVFYNKNNKYFPFSFLDNISNFLSNLSWLKRSLFIILDITLLIVLSSVYMIENNINKNSLIFNLNRWLTILHIYENHIATILFMILVLLFCTMDSDSAAKQLFKSWSFIFISRIGYFFYSICETTIIIFLIVTNYQTHLNIGDLLFLNFGQFICGIIISTIFVIIVEIPMRYFIKKLRKKIENKIFNKQNINQEPLINNNQKINLELISVNESNNNIENNNIENNNI